MGGLNRPGKEWHGGNWEELKARTDTGPKRKAATIFRFLTPKYEFWGRLGE